MTAWVLTCHAMRFLIVTSPPGTTFAAEDRHDRKIGSLSDCQVRGRNDTCFPPSMLGTERPVDQLARTISDLRSLGVRNREVHSAVLREILVARPMALAVWCGWEANAFDGRDADFRHATAHDATGRFVPYWHRSGPVIACEPLTGYEGGASDHCHWYSTTRRYGRTCATDEAFLYPIAGQPRWITCEITPLFERGRFVGVAGLDYPARPVKRTNPTVPILHPLEHSDAQERLQRLTSREREVHYWLCQGKTNEEIAVILGISHHTVKNHLSPIFQKLEVDSRYAAIVGSLS